MSPERYDKRARTQRLAPRSARKWQALPHGTALSTLASARAVFDATRLWQRDMYEHYQLGGGSPAKAAL